MIFHSSYITMITSGPVTCVTSYLDDMLLFCLQMWIRYQYVC